MCTTRNTHFLNIVPLLRYSMILFCLISLPKIKSDSELSFKVKYYKCGSDEDWPKIIQDVDNSYKNPKKVRVNNDERTNLEGLYSNCYCKLPEGDSISITLTFSQNINSYEKLFNDVSKCLQEITIVNFKTEKPISMRKMFYNTNFKKITFENIDTSLVTDMSHMFENCNQLKEVDLSKFNTSSLQTMNSMFVNCEKLENIDLSNFDTSSVTDLDHLFNNAKILKKIDLSNFKTTSLKSMNCTFCNCYGLIEIDISSFDTSSVTNMDHLFHNCTAIQEIDTSNFNTASVTTMNCTFRHCENLKVLDLRNFDTSKVTNMYDVFGYCFKLVYINLSSFDTKNVKIMQGMFIQCKSLKYLDVNKFNYDSLLSACPSNDFSPTWCKFHFTFGYCEKLICLNFRTITIEEKFYDRTFEGTNSQNLKYCFEKSKVTANYFIYKESSCDDQCFKDMLKKFDVNENKYVETCNEDKFDFNDLCWQDCPYHYYRIYTNRRTCSKTKPGENFFFDTNDNIYYQCYSSCKTCSARGEDSNHNCQECNSGYSFIESGKDKYAVANNCYKDCNKLYYFKPNHEYFCEESCPSDYKLISEKNKCIDSCINDDTYKNQYDNTCVIDCPKGTVNINNICKPCYKSCGACSELGNDIDHKCDECKNSAYDFLNNNKNCYEKCDNYYYFDSAGYHCLTEKKCPDKYKLIRDTYRCIDECKYDNIYQSVYEYNGECYKSCTEGTYTENTIDYCYCMENTTCKDCTLLAIENNLCSSCESKNGYYPKIEDKDKSMKSCYNSQTKPTNYILINSFYEPCYESCGTCSVIGDAKNHNCDTCKNSYDKLNNDKNCYKICDNYYYFNEKNEYVCLNEDKCPDGYKLIHGKKKCIKQCKYDNIFNFNFEYNGECYETCTHGDYPDNDKNICYCMENTTCKDCTLLAIEKHLCSSCNTKNGYYPIIEESKNEFMSCYNEAPINYYFNATNGLYESCYDSCATCSTIGTEKDHKCTSCKEGYTNLLNNNNCYKICDHYYYFNDENKYICLEQDNCPEGYKLISTKNKCIKNCEEDDIFHFNYEYNGVCLEKCPNENDYYTLDDKRICYCDKNPACRDCPYSNSGNNLCSVCKEGYYPKEEDSGQKTKECYNSKPTGYFLNENLHYEHCYVTCATCDEKGTSEQHNCKECLDNYQQLNKVNNDNNCYKKCDQFYYFDDTGYHCENKCPDTYKLIHGKNKCILNCKDDNEFNSKYEYNGECYTECENGYYLEDDKKICKCFSNKACKDCPSENNENNLCSTCDIEQKFYPKKEDKDKLLKNCYNTSTIDKNYIFIEAESVFESCYESCQTCDEIGTSANHKCTSCKNGYIVSSDVANNCDQHCTYFYYYNENKELTCTEKEECENNYKLVEGSIKCLKNCIDDGLFEYNNICYSSCPFGSYDKEGIQTCKCRTNIACLECPFSDNNDNLCYSCNNDAGYYPKKGESTSQDENGNVLMHCYNSGTKPANYFLNTKNSPIQYEPCYETCATCEEGGTSDQHNCKKCLDNRYEKLNLINNDNNCYEVCNGYYYFDNTGYHCKDKCPDTYKLIHGTNKCILNCKDDNEFNSKYEYNGECYTECENGYYLEDDKKICKCFSNKACKDCPSENNENNLCSTCDIEQKFYPKSEEVEKDLKACYNKDTIESNYILISEQYTMCYPSCETCELIGISDTDHKCKDCKEGFIKLKNNDNCYEKCNGYYYFDNTGYHCKDVNECPPNYKLIEGTSECVENCKDVKKYEYNNICSQNCPQYYTDNDYICKLNCAKFNLYFNFEQTDCISTIPKGYYLQNEDNKILGKCHQNCEECDIGPDENNNNCKTCPNIDTIYYDFGNCRESCTNGHYIDENSVKKCKCSNNIECEACDEFDKCLSCNHELGYYQIEEENNDNRFITCKKDPEGYYLLNNIYKKCHEKCKSCNGEGEYKCIECKPQYEFRNDFNNDKTCYEKCKFNYYYDSDNNNICTEDSSCPDDMKFIEPKRRCIEVCKNDNIYKFEYNGKCYERCPENTKGSFADNNICTEVIEEEPESDECNLKLNEFEFINDKLTSEELNSFTSSYASKYGKSNNYITKLENEYYKIFIYNNNICLQKVSQDAKIVDFGETFMNILLENGQLANPIITIITDKRASESTYSFSDPRTGAPINELNAQLKDNKISVLEDIYSLLNYFDDKVKDYIIYLLKQEIDLFDPNNEFYTNLCFYYDSPNNKDIAMKDRPYFYAHIPKCESGCNYKGIDFSRAKFKCECFFQSFSDSSTSTTSNGGIYSKGFPEEKSSTNIEVMKCTKDVFKNKYFKKCAGGIIMLLFTIGQIACTVLYFVLDIEKIKKHAISLFRAFKKYSNNNMKIEANPPKRNLKNQNIANKENVSSKSDLKKDIILVNTINKKEKEKSKTNEKDYKKLNLNIKDINEKEIENEEMKTPKLSTEHKITKSDESIGIIDKEEMYMKILKEYINPEFDEDDFEEVLDKDKRTFFDFLTERSFKNQIFIKTFYIKHIFMPLVIKIMILILFIELYFVISALFYSQNYLSDRFFSDEKEGFLTFVSKRIGEIILTLIICGIIQCLCSYFFEMDDHLKGIFKNKIKLELDSALSEFIKKVKRNYIILISICIAFTIFSFFYIASFNVVYPYIKSEWAKCSVLIFILMQIFNLLSSLLGTCCRYLSIKCKNAKLFSIYKYGIKFKIL